MKRLKNVTEDVVSVFLSCHGTDTDVEPCDHCEKYHVVSPLKGQSLGCDDLNDVIFNRALSYNNAFENKRMIGNVYFLMDNVTI